MRCQRYCNSYYCSSYLEHIGGSFEGFVYLMNEKANWLGMTNTHFDNPHGLESETHYSTAYDMALLMRYAMDNDIFEEVTGTITHQAKRDRKSTRLNSSHVAISYAVFCLKKKNNTQKY